ncbi:Hsp20/alpha crystallin family protein [Fulvivirga maritima]|uniref:Hsp20/alpha crystallin family protein n=1 Tax=Fulvivirga maritima TaxID=2904247 RepID=UPI001F20CE3B|nr:Hsp20/alpha crystallin family protein [Fulvivirga maritima]UII26354.1 Hsp20/alpha crystallin family protein [Fulvivirga maritima]
MTLLRTTHPAFNNILNDLFLPELEPKRRSASNTRHSLPKVNIKETKDGFAVEMAAPGLKKEDFKIQLDHNQLTISAKAKENSKDTHKYTTQEFSYLAFSRSFTLPKSADGEKIKASYENGILMVQIPKKELAKAPKAITIA